MRGNDFLFRVVTYSMWGIGLFNMLRGMYMVITAEAEITELWGYVYLLLGTTTLLIFRDDIVALRRDNLKRKRKRRLQG